MKTTRKQVLQVYNLLPKRFFLSHFFSLSYDIFPRDRVYNDSKRRLLFKLREEGIIHFRCIKKADSFYEKNS